MTIATFLNGTGVTRLRGAMFLAFSDTAIIQSRTRTGDTGGGATDVWNAVGTVACRIYPVSMRGKGALVGDQINEHSTHFCAMPPQTTIHAADRVAIANRGTFEVTVTLDTTDAFTTRVEVFQVS